MELIKRITPPKVTVTDPNDNLFLLNEYEFLHLRSMIKESNEGKDYCIQSGWNWVSCGAKYPKGMYAIDTNGKMYHHPPQFDLYQDYLYKLL